MALGKAVAELAALQTSAAQVIQQYETLKGQQDAVNMSIVMALAQDKLSQPLRDPSDSIASFGQTLRLHSNNNRSADPEPPAELLQTVQ